MEKIRNSFALTVLLLFLAFPAYAKDSGYSKGGEYPSAITQNNRLSFTLKHDDDEIAIIDGYSYYGGILLSLKDLFKKLNFQTTLKLGRGEIFGWYRDPSKWFLINTRKKEITINSKIHRYNDNQIIQSNGDIYADIDFLSQYFSFEFSVDYNNLTIAIDSGRKSPVASAKLRPLKQKPEPQISEEMKKYHLTDVIDSQEPVQEPKPLKEQPKAPASKVVPNEDDLLVFEVTVGNMTYDDLLETYFADDRFYIPLSQFSKLVEFPIEVDAKAGTAKGWYINEQNKFSLNLQAGKLQLKDKEYNFAPQDWFTAWGDIFILSTKLEQWLPIAIIPDFSLQSFELKPKVLLPFQKRQKRKTDLQRWQNGKAKNKNYQKIIPQYGLLQIPFADITLNPSYSKSNGNKGDVTGSYSALLSGDLAALNTNWFISGTDDKLNNVRVVGSRIDMNGNLFSVPGLTKFEIGDVTAIDQELTLGSAIGKGVSFSSFPLERPTKFDSTNINGDAQPGWEVELYLNSALIDFKVVGENGRYEFDNVPIFYGSNIVKMIFYGPQGEIREEVKKFDISSAILSKGDINYRASYNEKNRNLLDIQQSVEHGQKRFSGEVEYGLMDNLTISLGDVYAELSDNKKHSYQTFGATTTLPLNIVSQFNFADDSQNNGWATQFIGHTKASDIDVRFEQQIFHEFTNESNENVADKERAISSLSLSGAFKPLKMLPSFSYVIGSKRQFFDSGKKSTDINNRLSSSIGGFTLTNILSAEFDNNITDTSERVKGNFSLRGRRYKTIFRADTNYNLINESSNRIESVGLSLQRSFTPDVNGQLSLRKDFFDTKITTLNSSINWSTDYYRVSGNFTADDDNNYSAGMSLSFSLYHDPRSGKFGIGNGTVASSGATSAIAFIDKNNNYVRDEDEEILNSSAFITGGKRHEADENGIALLLGLNVNSFSDIILDESSLDDAFWVAAKEGYSVLSRSGVTTLLDIPVIETSEIEGTVYFKTNGKSRKMSGLKLLLLTHGGKPVGKTTTEFDGFYIFDRVLTGEYVIALAEEQAVKLEIAMTKKFYINISGESDLYSGNDIDVIHVRGKKKYKPSASDISSVQKQEPTYKAQLAAYKVEKNLKKGWNILKKTYPDLFKNRPYMYKKQAFKKGIYYVLYTGPFKSAKQANDFCDEMINRKGECIPLIK